MVDNTRYHMRNCVMRRLVCFGASCLLSLIVLHGPALAQEAGFLTLSLGASQITRLEEKTFEGRLDYYAAWKLLRANTGFRDLGPLAFRGIGPFVGLMANSDGAVFGYGGLYVDLNLGSRFVLWPAAGMGGYTPGGGIELGGVFQFHAGVILAYRFDNESRLGLHFAHISNARIHDSNPSNNSLLLTYTLPLGAGSPARNVPR